MTQTETVKNNELEVQKENIENNKNEIHSQYTLTGNTSHEMLELIPHINMSI